MPGVARPDQPSLSVWKVARPYVAVGVGWKGVCEWECWRCLEDWRDIGWEVGDLVGAETEGVGLEVAPGSSVEVLVEAMVSNITAARRRRGPVSVAMTSKFSRRSPPARYSLRILSVHAFLEGAVRRVAVVFAQIGAKCHAYVQSGTQEGSA